MSVDHARTLLRTEPHVERHDPPRQADALRALAEWALRFTPTVALDPPGGLMMDITGCQRLFRGDRRLLQRLGEGLERLGFNARLAIAPTFGAAWALARFGPRDRMIVADDRLDQALRPLPIAALRLDAHACDALAEVNVQRVDHLLALSRHALTDRFGPDPLMRLDQCFGDAIETLQPIRTTQPPRVSLAFDGPVKQPQALHAAARQLLQSLCDRLAQTESGARQVDVHFDRPDHRNESLSITLGHPSRQPPHLWRLLRPRLERIDVDHGIDAIHMVGRRLARLPHRQSSRWCEADPADDAELAGQFHQMLDVIAGRLGRDRICRMQPAESHWPDRTFALEPIDTAAGSGSRSRRPGVRITPDDRPSCLLARPYPVQVIATTPDGPPRWLRTPHGEHAIRTALGPQRLEPEWWSLAASRNPNPTPHPQPSPPLPASRNPNPTPHPQPSHQTTSVPDALNPHPPPHHRDYFKCQLDDGRWVWLYRAGATSRWYVHGLWA